MDAASTRPAAPAREPDLWLSDTPLTIAVAGTSMLPFLEDGDRIEVVRARPALLSPGQVVVFRRGEEIVIHRFLGARGGLFLEKGDAQAMGNWWPWPEAIGVAVAVVHQGLKKALDTPDALGAAARAARRHRRIHRFGAFEHRLPGDLPRRVLRRLLRPLL